MTAATVDGLSLSFFQACFFLLIFRRTWMNGSHQTFPPSPFFPLPLEPDGAGNVGPSGHLLLLFPPPFLLSYHPFLSFSVFARRTCGEADEIRGEIHRIAHAFFFLPPYRYVNESDVSFVFLVLLSFFSGRDFLFAKSVGKKSEICSRVGLSLFLFPALRKSRDFFFFFASPPSPLFPLNLTFPLLCDLLAMRELSSRFPPLFFHPPSLRRELIVTALRCPSLP